MTTIKTSCPVCGDVELTPEQAADKRIEKRTVRPRSAPPSSELPVGGAAAGIAEGGDS